VWLGGTWVAIPLLTLISAYPEPSWVVLLFSGLGVLGLAGLVTMVISWLSSFAPGATLGRVSVHDGVLRLKQSRDSVAIPVEDVTSAHEQAGGVVEIDTRAGDTWIVELDEDAAGLAAELGFAHGKRAVTYRLGNRFHRFLHFAVAYLAYQTASIASAGFTNEVTIVPMIILGFVTAYALGKRLIRAPVVTVANDGVLLETFGFRKRFMPIGDIVMAHQAARGAPVRMNLRDGTVFQMGGFLVDTPRRDSAGAHIRALLAFHAALKDGSTAALSREGRTIREWREHLRRVVEGSGYGFAATNDSLADLVTAPGVSPEQRVGAALALRVAGDENVSRIRVAAEQCVDPKTRAALEAAAREEIDERAIEKALR